MGVKRRFESLSVLLYLFVPLYILFFLYLNIPSITFFFRDPDQGTQLAKAMEILNGIHPFIDIKGNIYGPLAFYISALGQLFSGNRLIGEVIIILMGYLIAYLLIFYLIEKVSKRFYVSFILLTIALTLLPRFYKYYIVLGPALFLLALYYYTHDEDDHKSVLFLSLAIGLNVLFRFDFGVYSFLIGIFTIIISNKRKDLKDLALLLSKMILIISCVVLPWVVFVLVKSGSLKSFFELFSIIKGIGTGLSLPIPVFNFGESILSDYNNFSLLFWLFRSLPFLTLAVLFFLRNMIGKKEKKFILLTSFYTILIFIQALHRTGIPHLFQVIPTTFVLIGWIIRIITDDKTGKLKFIKIPVLLYLILSFTGWVVYLDNNRVVKRYSKKIINGTSKYKYFFSHNDALRIRFRKNKNIYIANLINEYTDKDEPVLFVPIESQLYYFSERLFKVSMGVLGPGRLQNRQEQIRFFNELLDSGTKIIVDRPFFSYDNIPERNPRHYYPVLMKYIYANYRIVARKGDSIFLCRDNRFNERIRMSKRKFISVKNNIITKKSVDLELSVDSINTFSPDKTDIRISSDSFLFLKGILKGNFRKYQKRNMYIGLKKNSSIYISRFRFMKLISRNTFATDLFSSVQSVPSGSYELIIFYKNDANIEIKNVNISLSIL